MKLSQSILLLVILLIASVTAAGWYGSYYFGDDPDEFLDVGFGSNGVFFGELVNQTQRQLHEQHGPPEKEWNGYHSLGRREPKNLPRGRIKTMLWRGGGGLNYEEGTVVVWLVQRRRGWVCFESVWFGDNVWFP